MCRSKSTDERESLGRSEERSAAHLVGFVKLLLHPGDRHLHRRTVSTQQCPRIDGGTADTDRRHAARRQRPPRKLQPAGPGGESPRDTFLNYYLNCIHYSV